MKLLVYHRDAEGRLWGPFTSGQTTELLNRGVLTNQSEMRPLHKEEAWGPLAFVWGKKNFPKGLLPDWNDPDSDSTTNEDMEHGDRQCEALALHVARKRSAADRVPTVDPPPLPFAFDLHQLERHGLAFQGWSRFDEPLPGVELRYDAPDKSCAFLRCMTAGHDGETGDPGAAVCETISLMRVQQAAARRKDRTITDESPVQGPGMLDLPDSEAPPHLVFILKDRRPVFCDVHTAIEEWWAHVWSDGILWEVEYFTPAVTVEYNRHWNAFIALLHLWPKPSLQVSRPAPAKPASKPKKRREVLPAELHKLCMTASDWAAGKLRGGDGWTALMMVDDAEGKSSATIYQQESWEEAENLAREELIRGHYTGSQMYVLARHVSWRLPGEANDTHAIMMHAEARDACPPVLLTRTFDSTASGGWKLNEKIFRNGPLNWSAYGTTS